MRHERLDVVRALAQGRDVHHGYVEAVIKIAPEEALFHAFSKVAVRGGDDADVDLAGLG